MYKTLKEIRSSILNQLRGGYGVDDDRIDELFIEHQIHDRRAKLIDDEFSKRAKLDVDFYQHCCLDVICEEVTCDGVGIGFYDYVVTIPKLLHVGGVASIKYFGRAGFKGGFSEIDLHMMEDKSEAIWTSVEPTYTRVGETKIIIKDPPVKNLKKVLMLALTADPTEKICGNCHDTAIDDRYPIPGYLASRLEHDVVQIVTKPMLVLNSEEPNNARSDTGQSVDNRSQTANRRG